MSLFDGISREPTNAPQDQDASVTPLSLVDEPAPRPQANLARGIVWADILADIAADEEVRQLRDAA